LANLGWFFGKRQLLASIFLVVTVVEALLALRFFFQIGGNCSPAVMAFSGPLVAPFKEYEPSYADKTTGVFEYTTVLAAEVNLVIAASLIT
jgi:hypothetical protein